MGNIIGYWVKITGGNWYEDKGHENVKKKPHTHLSGMRGQSIYMCAIAYNAINTKNVAR